jgi:hypothetical protein
MSYDDDWPDQTMENRRISILKTIRPISHDELKSLGETRFPIVTDPWCARYHAFIDTHADAQFFMADSPEGAEVIYCSDTGQGVWFLPGKGMGIIQPRGLQVLATIVKSL